MKEARIEIRGVIGAASPFRQGGSLRIILPKRIAKMYNLEKWQMSELENYAFVFLDTNLGILICPLKELLQRTELKELLSE